MKPISKVFTPDSWQSKPDLSVLLIDVPIEFRQDQNRLESLDDLLMQEKEWLSHCCARIVTRNPDVVFMSKSISHYAKLGIKISLVIHTLVIFSH